MRSVKAKKSFGQHFLIDESIAKRIVDSLLLVSPETLSVNKEASQPSIDIAPRNSEGKVQVMEIGPGTGVLTKYLINNPDIKLEVAEIDRESIEYLKNVFPQLLYSLYERDFLAIPLETVFKGKFIVIGNFPYNISSQIFFKILDYRDNVPQIVCMLQKEVAERLASTPGKKAYGILSVLLQAWYDIEYLFTVNENVFDPPPKVKSAVIRLTRNNRNSLNCNESTFKQVIKTCFNQRRKTIRNSIKPLIAKTNLSPDSQNALLCNPLMEKRPEQLSVEEFVTITNLFNTYDI